MARPPVPPPPPPVDPYPVTAVVVWTNSAGVKYDVEVSQVDGVTRWRVKGTTTWVDNPTTFYNSLGANIKVPTVPVTPPPAAPAATRASPLPSYAPTRIPPSVPTPTARDIAAALPNRIPATAQATPTPTAKYSTKKGRAGRTQAI